MRIVFILPGGGRSGGVRCTTVVANGLLDRGHSVRVLCRKFSPTVRNMVKSLRDRVIYGNTANWLHLFNGGIDTFEDLSRCKFDHEEIIVGVGMWASAELQVLSNCSNVKVQYLHGATPWDTSIMDNAICLPFQKIVVASYLEAYVKENGNGTVLAVAKNGIDLGEYFPCLHEKERDGVGVIYSSHPAKDPETVLGAIDRLAQRRPNLPIRVFGSEPRPASIPRSAYKRFPSVKEAREIYSRSLVWILGSESEGFPAPILEAMACGCAVVSTGCSGAKEIIFDGGNGLIAPIGDVDQIVTKVEFLIDNPEPRRELVAAGRTTVEGQTWEKCISIVENALAAAGQSHG